MYVLPCGQLLPVCYINLSPVRVIQQHINLSPNPSGSILRQAYKRISADVSCV